MKFRIERDALAEAVAWSARSLPARPAAPVLAGLLLEVTDDQLAISGFDYEVSTQAQLEVNSGSPGRALVSGRLLADIAKALPAHPVDFVAEGSRVSITCGSSKFTLPTMPDADYPRLPELPSTAGTVPSSVFARAVSQVAIAAGRDDTLPMLTGVRLEIEGDRLTLAATDRYRLAVRELTWNPVNAAAAEAQVLVPARTLHEAARSLTGEAELTISLSSSGAGTGEGIIGFSGTGRRTTTRLLDAQFPPYRTLLPQEFAVTAEVPVAALSEAVKRVALVAERGNPVRLQFADGGLTLTAGGDDEGRAEENLEAEFEGEGITTAFNPAFLLEGLGAIEEPVARLLFTTPTKPAVLRPAGGSSDYTYLIMPVRLPG
ncbi:MAG TPA: DNA polymerase III subunit beta [Jatrophihabitans sp.]|nr:DNA polymerase III subunit beta [Jatrophihabitans sp.]